MIEEMTVEEIKAHLKQREVEQIRSIDQSIRAMRGNLAEMERKRAELAGESIPTVEEPAKEKRARTPSKPIAELEAKALAALGSVGRGSGEIAAAAELTTAEARRGLDALLAKGTVIREGEKRGTTYRLAVATAEQADPEQAPAPEIDPFA